MPIFPLNKVQTSGDPSLLEAISAGLHGVLTLLEFSSERSEDCYAAHCLLAMMKARVDNALEGNDEPC